MSVNSTYDVDSIGGGLGGLGGGLGFLPWLLLFANRDGGIFGGGNEAGAGVLAGQTQAKLDCLQQGHNALSEQITNNAQVERFQSLSANIDRQADVNRAALTIVGDRVNDIKTQLADCCCDIKTGQLNLGNQIALQTNELNVNASNNTQKILDALNAQNSAILEADNSRLREQLNRSEIIAAVTAQCGPKTECNGGDTTNIDINVLRLLMANAQGGFNPGPNAQAAPVK